MKHILLAAVLCLAFTVSGSAQTSPGDAPASKADVERYLQAIHYHETMQSMTGAMSKPMQQMIHEQYMKDKENLPPDFETRMNKMVDDLWKNMPFDEMVQAMVPSYQKHFTKSDVDALVTFYSSTTGQKLLKELPAVTAESMQAIMPIMQQHMAVVNQRVQQEIASMRAERAKAKAGATP